MGLTLERRKGCRGGTDIRKTKGLERWDWHSENRRDGTVGLTDMGKTEIQIHLQETPAHEEDLVTVWSVTTQVTLYSSGQPEPATHKSSLGPLNSHYHSNTKQNFITFSQFLSSHKPRRFCSLQKESSHKTVCGPSAKTWRPPHSSSLPEKNHRQKLPPSVINNGYTDQAVMHKVMTSLNHHWSLVMDEEVYGICVWRVTDMVTKWQGEGGMSYLNVDVGGSFFITSTIFDSSPLLPRHISCLSTNLQLFIGILTSAVKHTHILLCCWSQEEYW